MNNLATHFSVAVPAGPAVERPGTFHLPHQAARTARSRRLRFFVVAFGVAVVTAAALFFAASETSEHSRFAGIALIAASADSRVVDALGSPITLAGSPGGRWTSREASLIAAVRGSKGSGTLTATGIRTGDEWKLVELVVKSDQGRRRIVVMEDAGRGLPAK